MVFVEVGTHADAVHCTLAPCVMVAGSAVSMRFSFGQPVTSEVHNVAMGPCA
jgi:hypothetical protein